MPSSPTAIHSPYVRTIFTYTPIHAAGQTRTGPPAVETKPARWHPALTPPRLQHGAVGGVDLECGPPAYKQVDVCQPVPRGPSGPKYFLAAESGRVPRAG